jgi:hypothetical protein
MIKRLLSILFLSSLMSVSCIQAQGAFRRFASSFKVPPFVSLAAANVASLVAFASLHNQKNDDLKMYRTMKAELELIKKSGGLYDKSLYGELLAQGCTNRSELKWAMDCDAAFRFDLKEDTQALIQEFRTSVTNLSKVPQTPEVQSLNALYSSLVSAFEAVSPRIGEPISQAELMPTFKPTIQQHLFDIQQALQKPALSQNRKAQLEKRKIIMNNLIKAISTNDFTRNLGKKITEKLEELKTKISETQKERDRLWMFPAAINGLIAMACGIHYFMSSK